MAKKINYQAGGFDLIPGPWIHCVDRGCYTGDTAISFQQCIATANTSPAYGSL
jgi:hypothetical protein